MAGGHVDACKWGSHVDAAVVQLGYQTGSGGVTLGGWYASAERVWNREGYYGYGAGANIADISENHGDPGGGKNARGDWFVREGASAGVGADIGPYRFDIHVESSAPAGPPTPAPPPSPPPQGAPPPLQSPAPPPQDGPQLWP